MILLWFVFFCALSDFLDGVSICGSDVSSPSMIDMVASKIEMRLICTSGQRLINASILASSQEARMGQRDLLSSSTQFKGNDFLSFFSPSSAALVSHSFKESSNHSTNEPLSCSNESTW